MSPQVTTCMAASGAAGEACVFAVWQAFAAAIHQPAGWLNKMLNANQTGAAHDAGYPSALSAKQPPFAGAECAAAQHSSTIQKPTFSLMHGSTTTRSGWSLPPFGTAALFSVLPLAVLPVGAPPPGARSRCAVGQPSISVSMARLSGLVTHSVSAGRLSCASSDRSLRACSGSSSVAC